MLAKLHVIGLASVGVTLQQILESRATAKPRLITVYCG